MHRPHALLLAALGVTAFLTVIAAAQTAPGPATTAGAPSVPASATAQKLTPREAADEREKLKAAALATIAGREKEPAGKVFKDIRHLTGVNAGTLLAICDIGYGRGLGVSCTHCHDTADYASNDKRPKRAAREMGAMMRTINREMLPKITELDNKNPGINCGTCHRGEVQPFNGTMTIVP